MRNDRVITYSSRYWFPLSRSTYPQLSTTIVRQDNSWKTFVCSWPATGSKHLYRFFCAHSIPIWIKTVPKPESPFCHPPKYSQWHYRWQIKKSENFVGEKVKSPRISLQREIDVQIWHFPLVSAVLDLILRVQNWVTFRNFLGIVRKKSSVLRYIPPVRGIDDKNVTWFYNVNQVTKLIPSAQFVQFCISETFKIKNISDWLVRRYIRQWFLHRQNEPG